MVIEKKHRVEFVMGFLVASHITCHLVTLRCYLFRRWQRQRKLEHETSANLYREMINMTCLVGCAHRGTMGAAEVTPRTEWMALREE
jgi:hypothetical protein